MTAPSKMDRLYAFLKAYHDEHSYMPVTRECGEHLDCSTSVVAYHLMKLEIRGDITRDPGKARAIRLNNEEATRR